MKKTVTRFIEIEGKQYPFRFSTISYINYQSLYGKDISQCKTIEDRLNYFYCAHVAGCNYEHVEVTMTDIEFTALLDEFPELLTNLANILNENAAKV